MPVAPPGGSPSGPPASTTHNPWARSLADLLQPWTDTLDNLYAAAQKNYTYCDGSLQTFENDCNQLVGGTDVWFQQLGAQGVPFQGLGAQAFNKVYLLNVDQTGVIDSKIQEFQNASHDLLTSIQSLNAQYELRPDGGIYWNAGPRQNPWSQAISQFLDNPTHGNNYVLSTLMDGFLTNTAVDDLLKPDPFLTVFSGVQIGVDQITKEINSGYQMQTQGRQKETGVSPSKLDEQQHQEALDLLRGFADNMIDQLWSWANELYRLAQTYLGKVTDAGNIPELTTPLPPKTSPHPNPLGGIGGKATDINPDHLPPTRTTYLGQSRAGKMPHDGAVNTVYVLGTNIDTMSNILTDLTGVVGNNKGLGLVSNLLGGAATVTGIAGAFMPVIAPAAEGVALAFGIASALLGGASTGAHILGSQRQTSASDAISTLQGACTNIQNYVSSMPQETQHRIVIQLSESDTYQEGQYYDGNTSVDLGPDYTQIASATFTLSCYTIQ